MHWKLVPLSDYPEMWLAWPRTVKMRLAWMVEDPEDQICRIEAEPGTGTDGRWQPMWIPPFSSEIREAFRICAAMAARDRFLKFTHITRSLFCARFCSENIDGDLESDMDPAMAICKAALIFCEKHP